MNNNYYLFLFILMLCNATTLYANNNYSFDKIKVGTAFLNFSIVNNIDLSIPDSLEINILKAGILSEPFDNELDQFTIATNRQDIIIPLETECPISNIGITIDRNEKRYAGGIYTVIQNDTINVKGEFINDSTINITFSNDIGFNRYKSDGNYNWGVDLSDIIIRFTSMYWDKIDYTPSFDNMDSLTTREITSRIDSIYSSAKKYATNGYLIPSGMNEYLNNNLKWIFALHRRLPIDQTIRHWTASDYNISHLSSDYYSFLNEIDYDNILWYTPVLSPFGFFSSILKYYPDKIDEIGNMPVNTWINETKIKLSKTIKGEYPILYELLAATSYSRQLKNGTPLSKSQIVNIKEGFDNDLSYIILKENDTLLESLSNNIFIEDLSGKSFSLEEYLSQNLNGIPTVIDLWNTWCGPCMEAQKIIKKSLSQINFPNIVFLYICDTSSSDQWKSKSQEFHGNLSLRINEESMQNIMEKYNIDGFPGYLFFNINNKIIDVWTGFHGIDKLYDCIEIINNDL